MQTNDVRAESEAVKAMQGNWSLAKALMGGTFAMRDQGEIYLPKSSREDAQDYQRRLKSTFLFPAFKRTVQTLSSKPFSKPLAIKDGLPANLVAWMSDVDLQKRDINAFAAAVLEHAMATGMAGILVDFPSTSMAKNAAEEKAMGNRPYFVMIHADQVLGWKAKHQNGEYVLTQLRLKETVEEDDGEFATKSVEQVRVLEIGKWSVWREGANKQWVMVEDGTTSMDEIPFIPVYGKRCGFLMSEPPLLQVAELNVEHWQSSSEQRNILHIARVPILVITGIDGDFELVIGANTAVKLPSNADMKFVEHSGKSIESGATDLDKLEERMRQAGAELLVIAKGQITATQVATENAVGMSVMQAIAIDLEHALNRAVMLMAKWGAMTVGDDAVRVFTDFGAASLAEATAELLVKMNVAGKLSTETTLNEMKRRGVLAADVDIKEEMDKIESDQSASIALMSMQTEATMPPPSKKNDQAGKAQ